MASNDISAQIMRTLRLDTDEVKEKVDQAAKEGTEEAANKLQSTSPKRTGKYAASWTAKKVGDKWVTHNKKHYRLTHLLEKSYAKRGGGRTVPKVHIRPVEQTAIDGFVEKVERAVEGN